MKSLKYIEWSIGLILIFLYNACTFSTGEVTTLLSQAEALTWSDPDSALTILRSIPDPNKLSDWEQANYALLISHIQYRCNIPISSDSLINIAVEYYKDKGDMDKRGGAWYVKGCILEENLKDIPQAIIAYKKAESCIASMKDKRLIARIYSCLGNLNIDSRNYELAKEYYQKAFSINLSIKDTHSQSSDLINLFHIYYMLSDENSLAWCNDQLQRLAITVTDSVLLAKVYHNKAIYQQLLGNKQCAEQLFLQSLQFTPHHPSGKTLANLAELYRSTGCNEKAESLYQNIVSTSDLSIRASIYHTLYQENLEKEQYKEATHYANLYIETLDSFYTNNLYKEVLKIQKEYDHMELLYQNSKLKNRWLFTLILVIIGIYILIYVFQKYRKKVWRRYTKLQSEMAILQNKFTEVTVKNIQIYEKEIKALQDQIGKKKKELDVVNNRMNILYGPNHHLLPINDIKSMQIALHLIRNRTCNLSCDRMYLKHWLNITRNDFAKKLESTYPTPKEYFLDVCYLTVLGLSIDEIAQIMNVNVRTVERYMGQVCYDVQFPLKGKKGFMEFLNTFISLK